MGAYSDLILTIIMLIIAITIHVGDPVAAVKTVANAAAVVVVVVVVLGAVGGQSLDRHCPN